jgi:hypothetical protein
MAPIRSQNSLEYMITYFWALIIIITAGAILWSLGVFAPQRFAGGSSCGGFSSFNCIDQQAQSPSSGNMVEVVLGNTIGRNAILVSGSITGAGAPQSSCNISNGNNGTSVPNMGKAYIQCSGAQLNKGDAYEWAVSLTYIDSLSGLQKTDAGGFIRGKVG